MRLSIQRQPSDPDHGFQVACASPSHTQSQLSFLPLSLTLAYLDLRRNVCFGGCGRCRYFVTETVGVGFRARFAFDLDVAMGLAVVGSVVLLRTLVSVYL